MPIRADILTQLTDVLAELYHNQGSIETMATAAGLDLARIAFYPRALDTWVTLLQEAEVHGRTLVILERAKTEKPSYEPLSCSKTPPPATNSYLAASTLAPPLTGRRSKSLLMTSAIERCVFWYAAD